MGMPRGLRRLTEKANTLQAWEDWSKLACEAVDAGMDADAVDVIGPNPQDGWRKIDKCIKALRDKLAQHRRQQEGG
jgi:hypothetical protein